MPGKYLKKIGEEGVENMKKDIANKDFPHFIYRETLADKSYRVDIVDPSKSFTIYNSTLFLQTASNFHSFIFIVESKKMITYDIKTKHKQWDDVPEFPDLDSSTESVPENSEELNSNASGMKRSNEDENGLISLFVPVFSPVLSHIHCNYLDGTPLFRS